MIPKRKGVMKMNQQREVVITQKKLLSNLRRLHGIIEELESNSQIKALNPKAGVKEVSNLLRKAKRLTSKVLNEVKACQEEEVKWYRVLRLTKILYHVVLIIERLREFFLICKVLFSNSIYGTFCEIRQTLETVKV